jgi:glutamine synthetase
MNKSEIVKMIEENNVSYLKLAFSDLLGNLKVVEVPISQIDDVIDCNIMFDGSSIEGLVRINESDMFLAPDLESFVVVTWEKCYDGSNIGLFMCDVLDINKEMFEGNPRNILKRQLSKMEEFGFASFNIGLEPEFFLFEAIDPNNIETKLTDGGGYFDMAPIDKASECRREIVMQLEKMGFIIEASHHEVSPSQHEINFRYCDAIQACDKVQIFKLAVKTIAMKYNMTATFMPKPIYGINGSGMHANLSLFDHAGDNVFYDETSDSKLSTIAYQFIGGLLKHAKDYTAITNPIVNSYKRLVPGYEAPVYIAYSDSNRSAMIRIPATRKSGTRVEVRSVDATANPYLAISVLLASGLDGIKNNELHHNPVGVNIFKLTKVERDNLGIRNLPISLVSAIKEFESSELMKEVLGDIAFNNFIENKTYEYDMYRREVHNWEINRYILNY